MLYLGNDDRPLRLRSWKYGKPLGRFSIFPQLDYGCAARLISIDLIAYPYEDCKRVNGI